MAQGSPVDAQIGEAWRYHREGKNDQAITAFEKVLQSAPNNLDGHYGMGLAQRAAGREADSIESFQKALEISQQMLQMIRSQSGGDDLHNNLNSSDDDRYMMLGRMIKQRLAELNVRV